MADTCICEDPRNAPRLDCPAHFFRSRERVRRAGRRAVDRHGQALIGLSDQPLMLPGDVRDGWGVRGWRKYGTLDANVTVVCWEPVR